MRRRDVLKGLALAPLLTPLMGRRMLQAASQADTKNKVEYLFVHSAHAAFLRDGTLTLSGINPATLYFSDRPERIVGHVPTDVFVDQWDKGKDNFAADPPNAALSILSGGEPQEIVVVLKSPRLKSGNLVYDVRVLDGKKTASGGASSLFIDIIGRPMTPMSFAGRHRRMRRRTYRRRR